MGNFKKDFIAKRSSCFKKEEGGGKRTQEEIRKLPSAREEKVKEPTQKPVDDAQTRKGKAFDAALARCQADGGCTDGLLNGFSREEYINS